MGIELLEFKITDEDIGWVQAQLGCQFDTPRSDVIKCLDSVDIQAFPGTGKTTTLVAKLAILARKWPHTNKGICVLSHTNTARKEIEDRLGNTEVGRKLLSYPHFIGTIHCFFDTFVAIPWLRSHDIDLKIIDTDNVLNRRFRRLSPKTKNYLENKRNYLKYLQNGTNLEINPNTPTYMNLESVKTASFRKGELTFEEVLRIAEDAIDKTAVTNTLKYRFPFVFIDEAQDTNDKHWKLVNSLVNTTPKVIYQCFGDMNQAIYGSGSDFSTYSPFPRTPFLTIPNSLRFGKSIASLSGAMSISQEKMIGANDQFDKLEKEHTIFLFDRQNPSQVLPAFAKHVLSCFSDDEINVFKNHCVHAVGQIKKVADDVNMPSSITHYLPSYSSNNDKKSPAPNDLIDFFRIGRQAFNITHETSEQTKWLCKGLCRLINNNVSDENRITESGNPLGVLIHALSSEEQLKFRKQLLEWQNADISSAEVWTSRLREVQNIAALFGIHTIHAEFIKWRVAVEAPIENCLQAPNTYTYNDNVSGRSITVELGTIHSVKGETHLATLLLETYYKKHNISSVLDLLSGCNRKKPIGKEDEYRMKCNYVALTRAKGLICVALPADSLNEGVEQALKEVGWQIVRL